MIFLECVMHLTFNLMIYQNLIIRIILLLVLLKINKTLEFSQLLMPPMEISKLEVKLHTLAKTMSLLYQEVVYFVKLRIYWLEDVIIFTGPRQKNTLSIISVLQPKALCLNWFILKVPCFLQLFGRPWMKNIILRDKFYHLFFQDRVKKMVVLIFQLKFVQDSQMIFIPQVLNIVTGFLDITCCVQFLQVILTRKNTEKGWLHQTLQPEVWIYAARMIQTFSIPLTPVRWLKIMRISKLFSMVYLPHVYL